MGCCASRDSSKFENNASEKPPCEGQSSNNEGPLVECSKEASQVAALVPDILNEASVLKLKILAHYNDLHAEELLNYCENIKNWNPVKSTDWMVIEKLDVSDYNKDYPMAHTKLFFAKHVPLKILLQQLNSPEHRTVWDSHVKHMEVIEGTENEYFIYRNMSVALFKADFVDKKIVAIWKNSVVVIGYGVQGKKEPVEGFTRGNTILSIHKISNENGATTLENFSQTNANSALAKAFAGLGPAKLIDWGKALRKRVDLMLESNN